MRFAPYPFQKAAVDHAVNFLLTASPGSRQLYVSPTGTGKSVVELHVQAAVEGAWIVTPRDEIVQGLLDKLGCPDADSLSLRIATPVKLRNRLLQGKFAPKFFIFDEAHHESATTYQQLDLLAGLVPAVGYTATGYRGSPRSTRQFLERWGEPIQIVTVKEAAQLGVLSIPEFTMLPLVDDDVVEVSGGEFDVESLTAATVDRLGDAAEHARAWYSGRWDRPTVFAMPSSVACAAMQRELNSRGLPALVVSASTPREQRQLAFGAVVKRACALLHINIVTEGVDLPLRRLVDMAPTLSPVRWVQQLGRITRPSPEPPEYVCTNRNLLRHAYALEGAVPVAAVVAAEMAFPPTQRAHTRVLGLEAIGRFKPVALRLANGANAYMYALSTVVQNVIVEYCCLVHPVAEPIWAVKVNANVDGKRAYGSWVKCDSPNDLVGFGSVGPRQLTEKQQRWWERAAKRYGLDPEQEVTRKNFQALPVLSDLGVRFT